MSAAGSATPRPVLSPWVIMTAGLMLLGASVAAIVLEQCSKRENTASSSAPYRGMVFEAVAPGANGASAGVRSRVLLLGSMHKLRPQDHPLPESYAEAIAQADEVVFELSDPERSAELIARHSTYPDGSTLREHLPATLFERADAAAREAGIKMDSVAKLRPFVLAQGLAGSVFAKAGFLSELGVESTLRKQAAERSLPVSGFETMEEQVAVFSSLPPEREVSLLESTLDEMERHPDYGMRTVLAWKSGDCEELAELRESSIEADPELAKALFEDRHQRWIGTIDEKLKEPGKVLVIVVGAAHLCGDGGLLAMLRDDGYIIGQW